MKAKELISLIQRCLAEPRRPASIRQPAEVPGNGPQAETMFVVDDDGAVREAMSDLLKEDGRTVEIYASS